MIRTPYLDAIQDPNTSKEQLQKEKEYKDYVDTHIINVKTAWSIMKSNTRFLKYIEIEDNCTSRGLNIFIDLMDSMINNHDSSKYSYEEWEGYRKNYYPVDDQEKIDNAPNAEKAWVHHYTTNMHHWDWWAKNNCQERMPLVNIVEMCCDWIAMSMKFGSNAYDWFNQQTDIVLGNKQRRWVIDILKIYYNMV